MRRVMTSGVNFVSHVDLTKVLVTLAIVFQLTTSLSVHSRQEATALTGSFAALSAHRISQYSSGIDLRSVCEIYSCQVAGSSRGSESQCYRKLKCRSCEFAGDFGAEKGVEEFCEKIGPMSSDTLILATSHYTSTVRLEPSMRKRNRGSTRADIQWDKPEEPLILSQCAVDDYKATNIQKLLGPDRPTSSVFHIRVTFILSVHNVELSTGTVAPDLSVELRYVPGAHDIDAYGKASLSGKCTSTRAEFSLAGASAVNREETSVLMMSITVPFDRVTSVEKESFQVRITCKNRFRDCDLGQYRFCARLVCSHMSFQQLEALLTLQRVAEKKSEFKRLPSVTPDVEPPQPPTTALPPPVVLNPIILVDDANRKDLSVVGRA